MSNRYRRRKNKRTPWTEKVGKGIGRTVSRVFENKIVASIIIMVMIVLLFVFVVPIKKNIVTIILLIVLSVLYLIFDKLSKK